MFCSPFHTFLFHFRLIPSTSPRKLPVPHPHRLRARCRAPRIYSVKFLPFGHRSFCCIAARVCRREDILRSFSLFTPFLRPRFVTVIVLTGSHWRGPTYKSPPPGIAERQPTTPPSSSLSPYSDASDARSPDIR
jgi:hypothetical protein